MKQFQIFNDCCPVCGNTEGHIMFTWTTLPEDKVHAHRKGHEILIFTCECGYRTTIERIPMITSITKVEEWE